jgi:uncharacterized protein YmfQ (DUF2313 family)
MLDMKAVFEALLPPGSLWEPAPLLGFDQFLTALGKNANDVYEQLYALGNLRDPRTTPVLSDLEKEYGILTKTNLSEAVRRQQLAAIKYARPGTASDTDLQTILRNAGFDVYVRRNHPPVDPADILATDFLLEAGEVDAFAGEPNAIAGLGGGELLVNGAIVRTSVDYEAQAGGVLMEANETNAVAGYFTDVTYTPVTYSIPISSDLWPYIFFVTGQDWGYLSDWNIEYATSTKWIPLDPTKVKAEKNTNASFINSGTRSLYVEKIGTGITNPGIQRVENILSEPIVQDCTISGYYAGSGSGTLPVILIQRSSDNVWIVKSTGITSTTLQSFSFSVTASDGVKAVGCGLSNSGTSPDHAYFDDILIEVDNVQRAEVPSEREKEFKELILKYKPLGTWAGLLVDYV